MDPRDRQSGDHAGRTFQRVQFSADQKNVIQKKRVVVTNANPT